MARGGYRVGAGRKPKAPKETDAVPPDVKRAAKKAGLSPLDYMLAVMNNKEADQARRDRMAIAAAPFCHPRMESVGQGKREEKEQRAKDAAAGRFATPAPPKLVVDNSG